MNIVAYMNFNGNCEEVMAFYKDVLGGEITYVQRYSDAPEDMPVSDAHKDKILHARLAFEGNQIYFSDVWEGTSIDIGGNISLNLDFDSEAGIRRVYDALCKDGQVTMEIQDTFWGAIFGSVKDKYGTHWSLNYTKPE